MSDWPLAFHITFGTYGTRLHGDERGTVHRSQNQPGEPIIGTNEQWQREEAARLKYPPVLLTLEQRLFGEEIIPQVCKRGGWFYSIAACREDHVHTLLTARAEPKTVRRLFKRWLGQALSSKWPLPEDQSWWAEGGSIKWVWKQDYLDRVYGYIFDQCTTPP